MWRELKQHPAHKSKAVESVEVVVTRLGAGELTLDFTIYADMAEVLLPPLGESVRADELWKQTCVEAFLKPAGGAGYLELNFSPSTQWAAYQFDGYREGMRNAAAVTPDFVRVSAGEDRFVLSARLLFDPPELRTWALGLSAIIEEAGGCKSYWALAHAPGKPDFHHSDSFAAQLGVGEQA